MRSRTRAMIAIVAITVLGALAAGVAAVTGGDESSAERAGASTTSTGGDEAGSTGAAMDGQSMGTEADADGVPFDQAFIDEMVPHHRAAVAMAEIARDRTARPEIKELAGTIIAAQEDEIGQMETWRERWYGSAATPAEAPAGHGGMGADLATAADVDRAFLEQMVEHHESAVEMAEQAIERAEHAEIRTLATSIRDSQRAEIDQMERWHEEWYGS